MPTPVHNGTTITYDFIVPEAAVLSNLQYIAEYSTDGIVWITMTNTGNASQHHHTVPLDGRPRLFTRVRVAAVP